MPWCPICKNEYKEGYTVCADCNSPLVDELETVVIKEQDPSTHTEDIVDALEYAQDKEISDFDDKEVFAAMMADEEFVNELKENEKVMPFVKASDKAENYKSSAFALLFVGILGVLFLILSYLNVIPISLAPHMAIIGTVVMGIMFVIFIIIGLYSLKTSKEYSEKAEDEDLLTESIVEYFKTAITKEYIDSLAFSEDGNDIEDEIKFLNRNDAIKKVITEKFGTLDASYLSKQSENMYEMIFENME